MQIVRRVVGWVLGLLAWLLLIGIAGGGLAAYLTASGDDLRLLKAAATGLGRLIDGQRTEAITIDATVVPEEHRLDAGAAKCLGRRTNHQNIGGSHRGVWILQHPHEANVLRNVVLTDQAVEMTPVFY